MDIPVLISIDNLPKHLEGKVEWQVKANKTLAYILVHSNVELFTLSTEEHPLLEDYLLRVTHKFYNPNGLSVCVTVE